MENDRTATHLEMSRHDEGVANTRGRMNPVAEYALKQSAPDGPGKRPHNDLDQRDSHDLEIVHRTRKGVVRAVSSLVSKGRRQEAAARCGGSFVRSLTAVHTRF